MTTDTTMQITFVEPTSKLTMPSRPITDPRFKWRDSAKTDVTRTWRKFRLLQRIQGARA